jgi:hypothetical protein
MLSAPGTADTTARREIALAVLYEYVQLPTTTEGTIGHIPVNLTVSTAPGATGVTQPRFSGTDVPITESVG